MVCIRAGGPSTGLQLRSVRSDAIYLYFTNKSVHYGVICSYLTNTYGKADVCGDKSKDKTILPWIMVACTMVALAPAELNMLRTSNKTVAIDELVQLLLMQCHKLQIGA